MNSCVPMRYTHILKVFLVGFAVYLLGCAQNNGSVREKVVFKPENTWGLPFKFTAIADASIEEKEWARAVAMVEVAEGSMGD